MIASPDKIAGIGMTSQRTRDRMVGRLRDQGIVDEEVLAVMARVPRHLFVDEAMATRAYEDASLPIGESQTISQPWVVARMTELLLEAGPVARVLEVGTGSGYQAAVLSELVREVMTVERIRTLLDRARKRFMSLQYQNIQCRYSDGSWGWPGRGPYDAIIVTAAPTHIPDALTEQLAVGGRMIVPVGSQRSRQSLTMVTRTSAGFTSRQCGDVFFVPFQSGKS